MHVDRALTVERVCARRRRLRIERERRLVVQGSAIDPTVNRLTLEQVESLSFRILKVIQGKVIPGCANWYSSVMQETSPTFSPAVALDALG